MIEVGKIQVQHLARQAASLLSITLDRQTWGFTGGHWKRRRIIPVGGRMGGTLRMAMGVLRGICLVLLVSGLTASATVVEKDKDTESSTTSDGFELSCSVSGVRGSNGLPGGQWKSLDINGTTQWVLVRQALTSSPEGIILFVHGGPGVPMSMMSHAFDGAFVARFHVVHWDQRASGRSAATLPGAETLNIDQYVRDTIEVLQQVHDEFPEHVPLVLLGHSWGTILGMHAAKNRPDLIDHLVLVGAVVDVRRGQEIQFSYLKEHSLITDGIKPPPWRTLQDIMPITQALDGAGMTRGALAADWETIFENSPDYSEADRESLGRGNEFTLRNVLPVLASWKIPKDLREYAIPVTMIYGDTDLSTPIALGREFYSTLISPCSRFVALEGIGHFAMWEANKEVADIISQQLRACYEGR